MNFTIKLANSLHSLSLGKQLGEGATARVHEIQGTDSHVFKEYLTDTAGQKAYAQQMQQKVEHFIDNAPPDSLIEDTSLGETLYLLAWPKQPVFKGKKFAGFVMPKIDFGKTVQLNRLFSIKNRKKFNFTEDIVWRLLVARNLANIYSELHKLGYYVIDTKPANLRTYMHAQGVCILDCDGFKLEGSPFQGEMITPDYIAPENIGASAKDMGKEQDLYALAIIIFQLFNNGIHPFSGKLTDSKLNLDIQQRIKKGAYAYGATLSHIQDPSPWSLHYLFPNKLASMFERIFKKGERPEASEWVALLDSLNDGRNLSKCPKGLHGKTFKKGCGACELEKLVGNAGGHQQKKKKQDSDSEAAGPWSQAPKSSPPASTNKSSGGNGLFWVGGIAAAMILAVVALNDESQKTTSTGSQQTIPACILDAKKCSATELCNYATEGSGSKIRWDPDWSSHTKEAKARGLRCGVESSSSSQINKGSQIISLSTGIWKQVQGKCLKENLVSNSPFSKVSFGTFEGGVLGLLIYPRGTWQEKQKGQIRFKADFGEAFSEPYGYYANRNRVEINMSAFEALFKRANWVDMTFPSGKTYRLSLSGTSAALNKLRQMGCG